MSGTTNLTSHLTKQGVQATTLHEATVVDNKDPDKLGRIRAKVKELHNGIEDKHLPWAIPRFSHVDGAKGGDKLDRSGTFYVPKKGSKVLIEFQDGDPHFPIWHGYTVDDTTKLKEVEKNYPDRAVLRFANGACVLIDTKTNEVFFHNAGDMYFIIQGDVEQEVHGNVQETCAGSKDKAVDKYFSNDKSLPVKEAKQHQQKKVKWKGLGKDGKSGNRHIEITGDFSVKVGGDRIVHVKGDDILKVDGDQKITVNGDATVKIGRDYSLRSGASTTIKAGADLTLKGQMIFLN